MHGIDTSIIWGVTRLLPLFASKSNQITPSATGFWTEGKTKQVLVTNRHVVDAQYAGLGPDYDLVRLGCYLRRWQNARTTWASPEKAVSLVEFDRDRLSIAYPDDSSDCAVVAFEPGSLPLDEAHIPIIPHAMYADADWFGSESFPLLHRGLLNIMDPISFLGYPMMKVEGRAAAAWDQVWQLPLARAAHVASWPAAKELRLFEGRSLSEVVAVDGLSFKGSSGSPVLTHEKRNYTGIVGEAFEPTTLLPALVGIMSGHWNTEFGMDSRTHRIEEHSGLSYFTKATSIARALQACGEWTL